MTTPRLRQQQYEAIPAVNWSTLKHLRVSPLEYQYRLTHPTDSPAFALGRATHAALYEPDLFALHWVVYPGAVRRGKEWEAFKAEHEHDEIVTLAERTTAQEIADAVRRHPAAEELLDGSFVEQALRWTDAETGIECKGRVDQVSGRLADLKTAQSIEPHAFQGAVARYGYHTQAAFYVDGLAANGIDYLAAPVLIAVEKEPPYDVLVYELPARVIEAGRAEYRRLLRTLQSCRASGLWPGRCADLVQLTLPAWASDNATATEPLTMGGVPMEF